MKTERKARQLKIDKLGLGDKVRELALLGYNCKVISEKIDQNKENVKKWCLKNNIELVKRKTPEGDKKNAIFITELKRTGSPKIASEISGIKSNGSHIIKKHNLQSYVNKRGDNGQITTDQAQLRLPNQSDKVISRTGYKFSILTKDGYTYEKQVGKLWQGDPRGKCGTKTNTDGISVKLNNIGYEYIEGFTGNIKRTISAKHNKCGKIRHNRFEAFERQECPYCCGHGKSKPELEILEWVQQYHPDAQSTRKIIRPKELDIYIPSLNLAIEYCGLYWHNENSPQPRTKNYHRDKMLACEKQGVRLITIFEDEWKERKLQVKGFLKSVIGAADQRIYARNCKIEEVPKEIAKSFLEAHHIQGKAQVKIAFGLYYEETLVGLVTGNKHHRQGFDGTFVLNRLVFKDGVQVVGGASRLLKKLKKYCVDNNYKKLISWSDNKISQGNVYDKTGWKLTENMAPDYSYVVSGSGKRKSKQSCKKSNLIAAGAIGTMENTELELSKSLNFNRIWDCGKKRWEINL